MIRAAAMLQEAAGRGRKKHCDRYGAVVLPGGDLQQYSGNRIFDMATVNVHVS